MRRRSSIAAGLAIAAALLATALVSPAAGAVPGLDLVTAGTGNSSANKAAAVDCPAGKAIIGTGARTGGGNGDVVIDSLDLFGESDLVVHGSEGGNGTTEQWSVRAYAICADVSVAGVTRGHIGEQSSDSPRVTQVGTGGELNPCALQDEVLTGVGGTVVDGIAGRIVIDQLVPSADLQGTTVRAFEHGPTNDVWGLDAHAICSQPLPGLQRVVATSPASSADKHATARCPAGKRVVGTGGEIIGGGGHVVTTYILPDDDLTRVHVRGAEDEVGTTTSWSVRSYAICAS